jgi:hypothetical protein
MMTPRIKAQPYTFNQTTYLRRRQAGLGTVGEWPN